MVYYDVTWLCTWNEPINVNEDGTNSGAIGNPQFFSRQLPARSIYCEKLNGEDRNIIECNVTCITENTEEAVFQRTLSV